MVIKNKEMVKLVAEQAKYFNENAPIEMKINVQKRIEALQKERKDSGVSD